MLDIPDSLFLYFPDAQRINDEETFGRFYTSYANFQGPDTRMKVPNVESVKALLLPLIFLGAYLLSANIRILKRTDKRRCCLLIGELSFPLYRINDCATYRPAIFSSAIHTVICYSDFND